jgi:hypothetical protein
MSLQSSAAVPPAPLLGGSMNVRSAQVTSVTKNMGQNLVNKVQSMTGTEVLALIPAPVVGQMVFITTTTEAAPINVADSLYVYKAGTWAVVV